MKVFLFGQLTDQVGSTDLEIPDLKDTDELRQWLFQQYPVLQHSKFVVSVDKKIAQHNTSLCPGMEIALLPPFSGG